MLIYFKYFCGLLRHPRRDRTVMQMGHALAFLFRNRAMRAGSDPGDTKPVQPVVEHQ